MRRIVALLSLAALSAVALVGLTRCNYVSDRVTAPRAEQAAQNCISDCAHQYNDSLRVESDLHVANVHACAGDSVCLALEDARHEAAVERIQHGRQACMDNCHHQGGGNSR
jgi:hypothetical protein